MQLEILSYTPRSGWSADALRALDSERTLVIVFGAAHFIDAPGPIRELADTYPRSQIVGCSTAGEILGPTIADGSLAVGIVRCVGRRLVLGERIEEELEATLDVLPEGTRQIGFYSYGEISPYATGHCDLHNQTMTLTTISES